MEQATLNLCALVDMSRAIIACGRNMGADLPDEGNVSVIFGDSIVQDTTSEKQQDMAEMTAGLMTCEEYRARWYGEVG